MAKSEVSFKLASGDATAALFSPETGKEPTAGVILFMDIFGPRASLNAMSQRIADAGYLVLLPDLFHHLRPYGPFDAATAMADPKTKASLLAMKDKAPLSKTAEDTGAFVQALTDAGATGFIGTVGYCMGGAHALTAAAAHPARIRAAASFHGGALASDAPDSPHLRASELNARVYVGSAGIDGSFPPEQSARLAQSLRAANVDYVLENYVGMAHGWAVPDHGVFDEAGSERHWKRLLAFFNEALA